MPEKSYSLLKDLSKEKEYTLLDDLVGTPIDIPRVDAPTIADPQDVEARSREVLELAQKNELSIKTVEENYDEINKQSSEFDPDELDVFGITEEKADTSKPGLLKRAGMSFLRKVFIEPLIAIETKSRALGGMGMLLEVDKLIKEFKEDAGREPTAEEFDELGKLAKAIYVNEVYRNYSFLNVAPPKTIAEKAVELGTGLGAFLTQLAIAKKVLGPGGTGRDVMAWEMVNMAEGGPVGKGAVMRLAFAGIEKVPTRALAGKVIQTGAQGVTLATATAISGGTKEDIAVAFLIPFALKAIRATKQKAVKVTRTALENRTVKHMRTLVDNRGYDLSGVPDDALREIIRTAKVGNWWAKQFKKGKINEVTYDKRLGQLQERIKPIIAAIAKQQPEKNVMAEYTKRITDRVERGGPTTGPDVKAIIAQGQMELDQVLSGKAPPAPPIIIPPPTTKEPAKPTEAKAVPTVPTPAEPTAKFKKGDTGRLSPNTFKDIQLPLVVDDFTTIDDIEIVDSMVEAYKEGNRAVLEQPISVMPDGKGGLSIIAGAHRAAAAKKLGIDIPFAVIAQDSTDVVGMSSSDLDGLAARMYGRGIAKPTPAEVKEKPSIELLGGVDPISQIKIALAEAKKIRPITEAKQRAERKRRVGAAAAAMKSSVEKGTPTDEAIFKSTGLLKGELTEYEQLYTPVEDILEPGAKEAAYKRIYEHPGLQYFETLNTAKAFKKLLAGTSLTPTDISNIENVFGKAFAEITEDRTVKSGYYDQAISIWKAGLLTGIKTTGLNTLANMSHAVTETVKDVPAVGVDSIVSLFTKKRTLAFTGRGVTSGTEEGVKRGWKYLKTGYDERNIGAKLDYKRVNFGKSKIAKGLQIYEETIFHLLGAEDQPFYYGAKARSLFSQAIAQAKNKKLTGKERDVYVEKAIANPTDEMLIAATHDAEVAVFQNRTKLGDIAKAVQKVKGGEVIVPFGRTPSAVAMQIINYSPVGAVKAVAENIGKGKFDQRQFSQAIGRAVAGTAALYLGTLLFKAGLMTLDRPDTERERELWNLEGRSANSIKIGDKWRSIQVLGPVGNVLLTGGHFQKQLTEEGSPTKAIVKAMAGGAKSFSEQTFVRGVNQAVDALASPERSFENWFTSMAGSAVPTIVADIARAADEQERRAVGPIERVISRIPIAREGLEPRVDVFGNDLPRYGGNVLEVMTDPSRPSKIREDIVIDELRRLFDVGVKASPTLLGDKKGFEALTTKENTRLWQRAGELTYNVLLKLINNPNYKKADDEGKGNLINKVVKISKDEARAEIARIKINQGSDIVKLKEGGLLNDDVVKVLIK